MQGGQAGRSRIKVDHCCNHESQTGNREGDPARQRRWRQQSHQCKAAHRDQENREIDGRGCGHSRHGEAADRARDRVVTGRERTRHQHHQPGDRR